MLDRRYLFYVALVFLVGYSLYWASLSSRDVAEPEEKRSVSSKISAEPVLETSTLRTTSPRTSILFLKTHKCASSTIQNILLRYGLKHNLDIALPNNNNYLGSPALFSAGFIEEGVRTPSGLYHIITHHTRLDSKAMREVLHPGAAFVTILREPAKLYESLFSYYNFQKKINTNLINFINMPTEVLRKKGRYVGRIGFNQMSWDLGLNPEEFDSVNAVNKLIGKIDTEFDLVMIAEYLEASLVLLADLMHWSLEDVKSIPLNVRSSNTRIELSNKSKERILELSRADKALYSYFLFRFRQRIHKFGEELMIKKVNELKGMNALFYRDCIQGIVEEKKITPYPVLNYVLNPKARDVLECKYSIEPELNFTDELRIIQAERVSTVEKLTNFLRDTSPF